MTAAPTATPNGSPPLVEVRGLSKHYPINRGFLYARHVGTVKAVDGVDFHIGRGETLALVGESGCGKSTTGRLILRLIEPTAGTVRFDGQDLFALPPEGMRRLRARMQLVFQDPYASLNPRMTIGEVLAEPLRLHGIAKGNGEVRDKVAELLGLVGLPGTAAERFPHEFSGGQRQRVGIARALAGGPQLIVADEPVSALDVSIRAQVVNLMEDLQDRFGLSYLFISHDLSVVRHMADRVAVMYLGRLVEIGPKEDVFERPRHPYTRALLGAVLEPGRRTGEEPRQTLQGDVPSPLDPPPGCPFHPRCVFAQARCRVETPVPFGADDGDPHTAACHFWPDLPPYRPVRPAPPPQDAQVRLKRLQAAFRRTQDAAAPHQRRIG
ncbi:MAG TPA: oligopeptide/dipeptide ABC transporter ATP-binding protein [Azospirillaceae bacterium]|nr:oligopeptide/dipeptide ABC transporter ATP-binding protein [Azospirillaceae bacterium]